MAELVLVAFHRGFAPFRRIELAHAEEELVEVEAIVIGDRLQTRAFHVDGNAAFFSMFLDLRLGLLVEGISRPAFSGNIRKASSF